MAVLWEHGPATIAPEQARHSALRQLTSKLFNGSVELLLTSAVSDCELTDEQVHRIRQLLEQRFKAKKNP